MKNYSRKKGTEGKTAYRTPSRQLAKSGLPDVRASRNPGKTPKIPR
jgi:hypothetical protein